MRWTTRSKYMYFGWHMVLTIWVFRNFHGISVDIWIWYAVSIRTIAGPSDRGMRISIKICRWLTLSVTSSSLLIFVDTWGSSTWKPRKLITRCPIICNRTSIFYSSACSSCRSQFRISCCLGTAYTSSIAGWSCFTYSTVSPYSAWWSRIHYIYLSFVII